MFTYQNPTTGNWDTTFYRPDIGQDVYIIYSDNYEDLYDDKFETDYNGKYRFENLRKGTYTFIHMQIVQILTWSSMITQFLKILQFHQII